MKRRKTIKVLPEEFDKTQLVEKELVDKISLWMLRIIINLGGAREFLDNNNIFHRDSITCFLEAGKYVDMDNDDFKRSEVLAILKRNHLKLEKRKRFTSQAEDKRTQRNNFEPANKLSEDEREKLIQVANNEEYKNLSPHQIVPKLADKGIYLACESTFYRLLREHKQLKHRHKAKPASTLKPAPLVATHE